MAFSAVSISELGIELFFMWAGRRDEEFRIFFYGEIGLGFKLLVVWGAGDGFVILISSIFWRFSAVISLL